MTIIERVEEAERVRSIMGAALTKVEEFLGIVCSGYVNKPQIVDHTGHEAVRFVTKDPCDAVLMKFARVVSLCRAMLVLMDIGHIQEQAIIQRSIEETNEDILFFAINLGQSEKSPKFEINLTEFWKEDYEDPSQPTKTAISRGFSRKGIASFMHRVFGQTNPSLADEVHQAIYSMYSGFSHGAAPQIMELYDFENERFLTRGLLGTNRHLDYVMDGVNSVYRTILSARAVSKALGSAQLDQFACEMEQWFLTEVGEDKIWKNPT